MKFFNAEKPRESSENQQETESRKELTLLWRRWLKKLVVPITVAGVLLSPYFKTRAEGYTEKPGEVPAKVKSGESLPLTWEEMDAQIQRKLKFPGVETTFIQENEKGEAGFNFWSLIAPIQLEFTRETKNANDVMAILPYEYSRLFDTAKPLRAGDREKIINNIEQQIKSQIGQELVGLDWSQRVHRAHGKIKETPDMTEITSLSIIGTTSPEGPSGKGSETIKPEAIDQENIKLGALRAENMKPIIAEYLSSHGIKATPNSLDALLKVNEKFGLINPAEIKGKEIQFSSKEITQLVGIADELKITGADDYEKIYNLIRLYNDNGIDKPLIAKQLDKIIAGKRSVVIHMGFQGKKEKTLLVPIPLLLLLPLVLRRRRKENEPPVPPTEPNKPMPPTEPTEPTTPTEPIQPPIGENVGTPISPEGKNKLRAEEIKKIIDGIPQRIKDTLLPPKGTPDYDNREEITICDDLNIFWNNEKNINRGLDYPKFSQELLTDYNNFSNDQGRELYLTNRILIAWKANDRLARQEAGIRQENLDTGLDYENQPNQIIWARMHARKLIELVEDKRKPGNADKSLQDLLMSESIILQIRRLKQKI